MWGRNEIQRAEGEQGGESSRRTAARERILLLREMQTRVFSPWISNCSCGKSIGVSESPNKWYG
jgi:hypothetical protein